MFWRLFLPCTLLLWSVLAVLALGLLHVVEQADARLPLFLLLALAALGGSVAGAVVCGRVAGRLSRALRELIEVADRISTGPCGQRVFLDGTDELGRLGRTFNRLSERLAIRVSQLEEDRQQLRTILSGMVEGVVALDAEQRILFVNERAAQLLEFPTPPPTGRRLWEVVRQRPLLDVVQRALERPEPLREEFQWNGSTARSLTVHAARLPPPVSLPVERGRMSPSPPAGWGTIQGGPRGAVLVLHDTTDLRRLERLRQEFVANVSHELKTPLSVIKANVETLIDGAVDDTAHRGAFLRQIASQSDRLLYLILDLISLARIESGEELFEFTAVPVEEVVLACLERHRTRAEARQQTLTVLVPPDIPLTPDPSPPRGEGRKSPPSPLGGEGRKSPPSPLGGEGRKSLPSPLGGEGRKSPPSPLGGEGLGVRGRETTVWADEEALDQILDNLLDNALKYTPEGGQIRVSWQARSDVVCLEVTDTGIGIPEADLPRIFERFYRVDKARSREMGGTGLGLSIVKHLTQALGGTVTATSKIGVGTTFLVSLPRAPTPDSESPPQFHRIYTDGP